MPVFNSNYLSYLLIIPGLIIGFIVTVIIHELGHLVFGLITGYKFTSFKVFFIKVYYKNKIKIKFEKGNILIHGQCLMRPTNRRYFLYNLGGVIFNYILTIILFVLFYTISNEYIIQLIFGALIINTLLAIMNCMYHKDGINDICNIVRCMKNKDYLEGVLYQLDIVSNVTINDKFKSKYNPSDDVKNIYANVSIYRFRYLKAYNEGNIEKMNYYYKLLRKKYNSIYLPMLKLPTLILLLNHEFIINNDIVELTKIVNRVSSRDVKLFKKYPFEYSLFVFYKDGVVLKKEYNYNLLDNYIISNPEDLVEKLNNKMYSKIKRVYIAYINNDCKLRVK